MKVRAKERAIDWFNKARYRVTLGKIYDFPNIVFDDGKKANLNPRVEEWLNEFEFLPDNQEEIPLISN